MSIAVSPSSPTNLKRPTAAPSRVKKTKKPIAKKTVSPTTPPTTTKPSISPKKTHRPSTNTPLTLAPTATTLIPTATPTKLPSPSTSSNILSYSPSNYTWRLDFSKTCSTNNITEGPGTGISDSYCTSSDILGGQGEALDNVPIVVNSILIVELDLDLAPVNDRNVKNINLKDGEDFSFTSIGATAGQDIPLGGLQMRLEGQNDVGVEVAVAWIVTYTNNCTTQVFFPGNTMGWVIFVSLFKCSFY